LNLFEGREALTERDSPSAGSFRTAPSRIVSEERLVMEVKTVGEIMVPLDQYPVLKDSDTLRHAIDIMQQSSTMGEFKGIPRVALVFDELNILVGLLRRRDILRGLEPQFLLHEELDYRKKLWDVQIDPNLSELSWEQLVAGIREQADRLVTEVMIPIKLWISADDHIMKAIYEMVDNSLSILPVLKGDSIVGVVRSVEVFQEAARLVTGPIATHQKDG
jgi:CBS domain-containing protein